MSKPAGVAIGAATAVGAAALAWGTLIERNLFGVRHEVLPVLPSGAERVRILHLSDIHVAPGQDAKVDWIRSLAELEPDLVINTGDNLGHRDANAELEHLLAPFEGVPGVFVTGSNDYYGPVFKNPLRYFGGPSTQRERQPDLDTERMFDHFENTLGWTRLDNAAATMSVGDQRFEFFGTGDAHRDWDDLGALPRLVDDMREHLADESPAALSIGVTHAPYRRVLDAFVTQGADVIFAGHTHGGQVRIPGFPALVTNCDIPRDQAQGLSVWAHAGGAAYLEVSAGLGTSIYAPVRFACPPEAVIVDLLPVDIG